MNALKPKWTEARCVKTAAISVVFFFLISLCLHIIFGKLKELHMPGFFLHFFALTKLWYSFVFA